MKPIPRALALIAPRHLIDRRRFGEARAADLARLRARFAAQPGASKALTAEAMRLTALKRSLAAAYAAARSCARCATGCPSPRGAYAGGRCCGTETLTVFSPEEVRLMKLAGRDAPSEAAGFAEDAGCAFRGPEGCVREPEDRPVRCLVYECEELAEELDAMELDAAELDGVDATAGRAIRAELATAFAAWRAGARG